MKAGKRHKENYVKYMATRDGVEKVKPCNKNLEVTDKQKELINELLEDIPEIKDLFEYEDYVLNPTRENASALISASMEYNLDAIMTRENYVNYIATRPRVAQVCDNGMFTDYDGSIDLESLSVEVGSHTGNVWTHIISLRREDATRLGFDNVDSWINLCRAKRNEIANQMNIKSDNIKWYAAFHNEGHHPHIHMIAYSIDPREGYVTQESISNMRSTFANEIFKQDLINIYKDQTSLRDTIKEVSQNRLKEIINNISNPIVGTEHMIKLFAELKNSLSNYTGRSYYAYVSPSSKKLIDQIMDELSQSDDIKILSASWHEKKNDIYSTYRNDMPEQKPLSSIAEFKRIKNVILDIALHADTVIIEESDDDKNEKEYIETNNTTDFESQGFDDSNEIITEQTSCNHEYRMEWSKNYNHAKAYLYGTDKVEKNMEMAIELLKDECRENNVLAMYDLANIYDRGLGNVENDELGNRLFKKSLEGFESLLGHGEKREQYVHYRIGKFYMYGQGTEIDYSKARNHFEKSSDNIYALYNLGTMFNRGLGVNVDKTKALDYFLNSTSNPYSAYASAELIRNKEVPSDKDYDELYKKAYDSFLKMEKQSHDDNLQYRLGKMLYQGFGVAKNIPQAIKYLEESASMENKNAKFLLSKIYMEQNMLDEIPKVVKYLEELSKDNMQYAISLLAEMYRKGTFIPQDIEKAIHYHKINADQGDEYAQYQVARLLLDDTTVSDKSQGMKYLKLSAVQGLDSAQYRLGKHYLLGDCIDKDITQSLYYLKASASHNNEFAQLLLGKLFLCGIEVEKDLDQALYYLQASANQGNIYAQYFIDHMNDSYSPSIALLTSRLFHHVSRVFSNHLLPDPQNPLLQVDSKLKRKLLEKKSSLGHKMDDRSGMNPSV